ncbi:MAG: ABC transporter permease [Flavisolibacter sp.]
MIRNYVKIAFRQLARNKTFSLINILGLTAGTLCCLYILLYVTEEYSFDRHHQQAKDIYRVTSSMHSKGDRFDKMATTSPPVAPAMKNDFSQVKQFTRVVSPPGVGQHLFRYKDKLFYETQGLFVDSTFFQVFTYHFLFGSPYKALQEPYTIVLTSNTAEKLFGSGNPIGEVVQIDNSFGKHDFKVTGVVDNAFGKTHLQAHFFVAMNSGGIGEYVRTNDSWAGNNFVSAYVKLQPGTDAGSFEKLLPGFLNKYGAQQLKEHGMQKELHLQPVTSIHTTPGYSADMGNPVSPTFLYALLFIAAMIQLVACINFMNLSTARSYNRAKEVGVRKTLGAARNSLIQQFLTESMLLSVISIALAIPLLWILLPFLNHLTDADVSLSIFSQPGIYFIILGLVITTALLAGSYPAFYLSAFKVIKVLKGNYTSHIGALGLRKGLVVFQFALSVVMIIGIIVINRQLRFLQNKDLGFEKSQRLILSFRTNEGRKNMEAIKNKFAGMPEITSIAMANNYPSQFVFNDISVHLQGDDVANSKNVQFMMCDQDFINTLGIHLRAGRNLSNEDSGRVVVNESTLRALKMDASSAIGTKIFGAERSFEIIGVMKDFNFNSLHDDIHPFMLMNPVEGVRFSHMILALNTKNYQGLLQRMATIWHQMIPSAPFEYQFLDEQLQRQYKAETTLSSIINSFTLVAVIISCLGLFGLAAFTAEKRTKEIGIRKVLGASVPGLVALLSLDFLKLILISITIASPLAWWVMNKWLGDFAYRTAIDWWIFGLAALLAIGIAFATVSYQAVRAALANPVKNLRTE